MKTRARLLAVACACITGITSCFAPDVRSSHDQLDVRLDAKADELRIAITSFDLSADPDEIEEAERNLQRVLTSDRALLMGWVLDLDEMQREEEKKEILTAQDKFWLQIAKSATILQKVGFFDDRGRPGLTQLVSIKDWSKVLELWNAKVDEEWLLHDRDGNLRKYFGEDSAALIRARARLKSRWIDFDEAGFHFEFPLTKQGWDLLSQDAKDEGGVQQVLIPLVLCTRVSKQDLSWAESLCRVRLGARQGNHFHFEPTPAAPHPFSGELGQWLEQSAHVPNTRAQHTLALRVIDTLEPAR